jgi:hypothetical protein
MQRTSRYRIVYSLFMFFVIKIKYWGMFVKQLEDWNEALNNMKLKSSTEISSGTMYVM